MPENNGSSKLVLILLIINTIFLAGIFINTSCLAGKGTFICPFGKKSAVCPFTKKKSMIQDTSMQGEMKGPMAP